MWTVYIWCLLPWLPRVTGGAQFLFSPIFISLSSNCHGFLIDLCHYLFCSLGLKQNQVLFPSFQNKMVVEDFPSAEWSSSSERCMCFSSLIAFTCWSKFCFLDLMYVPTDLGIQVWSAMSLCSFFCFDFLFLLMNLRSMILAAVWNYEMICFFQLLFMWCYQI
jgi:hypothetical protein